MSQQRQIILDNIRIDINDIDEDDQLINNVRYNRGDFLEILSQIRINWNVRGNDPTKVIFCYPVVQPRSLLDPVAVESVAYNVSQLPTALEVIGAINTYYGQDFFPNQAINNLDNIDISGKKLLVLRFSKNFYLGGIFSGLEFYTDGIYYVRMSI